jgi:peptidoglycan-N-acetylglucosamine deacetylase
VVLACSIIASFSMAPRSFSLDAPALPTGLWKVMKQVLWAVMLSCALAGRASGATEMAVTIDDLPTHGALPKGTQRTAIAEQIISILKRHAVPEVYGFVNGGQIRENPDHMDILRMWVEAGLRVGNHTFAHPNLNRVSAADYIGDIERNEVMLVEVAGPLWGRVFRYPYLHEGDTLQKRRAVRRWLAAQGYQIAQVTVYFDDWAWNDAYARCVGRPDPGAIQWLKQSFLQSAMQRLAWSEAVSKAVLGQHIKQILLLHLGAFDAVMLDELLAAYRQAGVTMIGLTEAMADSVYRLDPDIVWDGELIFLLQVARARKLPIPPAPAIPLRKLSAVCR